MNSSDRSELVLEEGLGVAGPLAGAGPFARDRRVKLAERVSLDDSILPRVIWGASLGDVRSAAGSPVREERRPKLAERRRFASDTGAAIAIGTVGGSHSFEGRGTRACNQATMSCQASTSNFAEC